MSNCENILVKNSCLSHWTKTVNALFLISGTCIGGGMLAMPVTSSHLGFWPSVFMMLIACIFMTITGLLFLEATLWMRKEVHVISLSKELLNKWGQFICWIIYLFIGYASLVAYTSGGGKEISFVFRELFQYPLSEPISCLLFFVCFALIIYLGHRSIGRVNTILFVSMIIAYFMMIVLSPSEVKSELIQRQDWSSNYLLMVMPLMITTFSFPGIVPTVVSYLNRDIRALRIAIIGGTSLTFLVYFLWLWIVLGTVPNEGPYGLQEAFLCDLPATECLHHAVDSALLSAVAQFFAFFALATSFLGIGLALFDFLSDGLRIKKNIMGRFQLILLIAFPTIFFAIYFERAFITALELTGGIGDALISGIIPAVMVWKGRYYFSKSGDYQVVGGKPLLVSICLFSVVIMSYEIIKRLL